MPIRTGCMALVARFSVCTLPSTFEGKPCLRMLRCSSFYALSSRVGVAALGLLTAAASFAAIELPAEKAALIALGEQHRTASDLYKAFSGQANGGQRLNPARLPDWTGVYSRSGILFNWDQDQGPQSNADGEADARVRAAPRHEARQHREGHRVRQLEQLRAAGSSALDDGAVLARLRRDARSNVPDQRDGQRHSPHLHRRPRPHSRGRSLSALERRLDRLLGRRQARHPHELAAQRPVPAHAAGVHGASRDRRDLGEGRRQDARRARLGLRSAVARAAVVLEAHVLEADERRQELCAFAYWDCAENQNNTVIQTEDGSSQFRDFTFTEEDD